MKRVVVVAMIGALEFEHQFAAGEGAGKPQRIESRLSAVADKFHRVRAGDELDDARGKARRHSVHGIEAGAARRLLLHCGNHPRMGVPDHHRPGAEHEIDQRTPVGASDATSLAAADNEGDFAWQLESAEAVAGNGVDAQIACGCSHCAVPTSRPVTTQEPSARSGSCSTMTP